MSTKTRKSDPKFLRAYASAMLCSAFVSLFWAVISERRRRGTYTLIELAKQIGANKAEVSRWFRGHPNWTLRTIAKIADALNVDLRIEAVDRASGEIFTPAGIQNRVTPRVDRVTSASSHTEAVKLIRIPPGTRFDPPVLSAAA